MRSCRRRLALPLGEAAEEVGLSEVSAETLQHVHAQGIRPNRKFLSVIVHTRNVYKVSHDQSVPTFESEAPEQRESSPVYRMCMESCS